MEPRSQPFNNTPERALLVGLYRDRRERFEAESSLEELGRLADTAGALVSRVILAEIRNFHPSTLIGKGKAEEIREEIGKGGVDLVIFDQDLSPAQSRNLEEIFGARVVDRTGLILDIFARRARSHEGRIQVELAQLKYLLPRLVGRGKELSQLAGGIGTRGPGETQLEIDQRKVRSRISLLSRELHAVRRQREIHRRKREGVPIALVSLIGYTNAGKSTLMNYLTHADVLVEDKLFVTLDPTVRRLKLPSGREILLADTVGFVRNLPHQLVEAFRATFEEVQASDLLLHIVDAVRPSTDLRVKVVEKVLNELELDRHPILRVFNKMDQDSGQIPDGITPHGDDHFISALRGDGIPGLLEAIDQRLAVSFHRVSLLIPHASGSFLSLLYATSRILARRDLRQGVFVEAEVSEKYFNKFKKFRRNS